MNSDARGSTLSLINVAASDLVRDDATGVAAASSDWLGKDADVSAGWLRNVRL